MAEPTMQSRDNLDSLESLQISYHPRHGAQNACLLTGTYKFSSRWGGKETAVAGSLWPQVIRAELAFESLGSATHKDFAEDNSCVGQEISGWCIIGAVKDDIIRRQ